MPLASILKDLALKFTLVLIRKLVVTLFDSPVFNSNLIGQFFLLIIENQLAEITECELNCREALCGQEQT